MRRPQIHYLAACAAACLCAALANAQTAPAARLGAGEAEPSADANAPPAARTQPLSEADRLAAGSLYSAANSLLYAPGEVPGRAGRILALARTADRLMAGDPDVNWMLACIYQAQGRHEELKRSLEVCFAAHPSDHILGVQLLRLNLDMLDTAEARLSYLRAFGQREGLPLPLRAEALAEMGRISQGQGRPAEARAAFEEAIRLDPAHPGAAGGLLALRKDATTADRLRATLAMIRGCPRSADLALQAGTLLEEATLYTQALVFFEHAWEMSRLAGDPQLQRFVLPRYCNAMLAAKEYRRAVGIFAPLLAIQPSPDLHGLLVEAYQAPGVEDRVRAERARSEMLRHLKDRQEAARRQALQDFDAILARARASGRTVDANAAEKDRQALLDRAEAESARELAWYYEATVREPNLALSYAQRAAADSPDDPVVQRLLGIAELLTGRSEEGIKRLRPLVKTDGFAAKFVAEYHFGLRPPNLADGNQAIQDGVAAGRSGPAYRQLAALAAAKMITIPPPEDAGECLKLYESFIAQGRQVLEMPRTPGKFLSVTVRAVRDPVPPGMPVAVEAVLTNISSVEVPLGDWGMLAPRLGLQVRVPGVKEPLTNLPVVSWAAPRYLAPGAALAGRARLDVGTLATFLAQRPLEDLLLGVASTLDPVPRGSRLVSSLDGNLAAPFISLKRIAMVDLAEANDPERLAQAASVLLRHIVYDMKYGELSARMLAARRTASLLALQRRGDLGKAAVPRPVAAVLTRPVLLRMMVEALKDPSDVIRAEMLGALDGVPLDEGIVSLLAPLVQDVSPLVRMRLAEVLGASGLRGQTPILEHYAKDRDEMVRLMASAFLTPPKNN